MVTYGQSIGWNSFDGTESRVTVDDCATPQEAMEEAIGMAQAFGWSPPKWWQWWRWSETQKSRHP